MAVIITDHLKRKQKTVEDLSFFIFRGDELLTMSQFARKLLEFNMGLTETQAEDIFLYIDLQQKGSIGRIEFTSVFH